MQNCCFKILSIYICKELFEDAKGVIRSRKSRNGTQYNGKGQTKDKKTNNDLQNTTQKTKDYVIRPPKTEVNSCAREG